MFRPKNNYFERGKLPNFEAKGEHSERRGISLDGKKILK